MCESRRACAPPLSPTYTRKESKVFSLFPISLFARVLTGINFFSLPAKTPPKTDRQERRSSAGRRRDGKAGKAPGKCSAAERLAPPAERSGLREIRAQFQTPPHLLPFQGKHRRIRICPRQQKPRPEPSSFKAKTNSSAGSEQIGRFAPPDLGRFAPPVL